MLQVIIFHQKIENYINISHRLYSFKTNEERLLYISNLVDIAVFGLSNIGVFRPQATSTDVCLKIIFFDYQSNFIYRLQILENMLL